MVCRSTPGNSGITSYARHSAGLLDVQVLSMFHEVRASVPRDLPGPTREEVQRFTRLAADRVHADTTLPDRERRLILNRLHEASRGPLPDGRTYYAWQNIEAASRRSAEAMTTQFRAAALVHGGTPEQHREAFNQMMRRDHRIDGEVPRAPQHITYAHSGAEGTGVVFAENVPRDRGTRYALAMIHHGAAQDLNDPDRMAALYRRVHDASEHVAANAHLDPANHCPDCGEFAGDDHVCSHPDAVNDSPLAAATPQAPDVSYTGLQRPSLRETVDSLTPLVGSQYLTTDGRTFPDRIEAVRHQRNLTSHAALRQAVADTMGYHVDSMSVAEAIDLAARTVRPGRSGVREWATNDGRTFYNQDDAVLHQFHVNRAPAGSFVLGQSEHGAPLGNCATCGQFMGRDHVCAEGAQPDPLADWEQELTEGAEVERAVWDAEARDAAAQDTAAAPDAPAEPVEVVAPPMREPARAPVRRRNPLRTYRSDDGGSVRLMNVSAVRETLRVRGADEPIALNDLTIVTAPQVDANDQYGSFQVTGSVSAVNTGLRRTRNRDRFTVEAGERTLRCTCAQYRESYDCVHVREAVERVQALLNDRDPVAVAPAQAMQTVGADLRGEFDASQAAAQQARAAFAAGNDGVSYAESMTAFQATWDEAKAHFEAGNTALPYMIENATNGLGAREGGRSFGLEIEIDFPEDMSFTAKERVAREIYEAGLSDSPQVRPWHWRARQTGPRGQAFGGGYTDDPNMWSVEFDRSVDDVGGQRGCELVSPILYDTPDTWRNLQTILDIVERNGGRATPRTGLHVNVGARDYDHTVENHNRLIGLANGYEDVIVRTSHNPQAGRTHRGREYCRPMTMPANGYSSIRAAQRGIDPRSHDGSSHRAMINLDHVPAEGAPIQTSTRVEVRIFDGSTDPGRIQMATKMALGMVNAAVRGAEPPAEAERAGTHRARNAGANGRARRLRGEEWENDTRSFRQMADTLFTREEDKKQFTYAFAASRWQSS